MLRAGAWASGQLFDIIWATKVKPGHTGSNHFDAWICSHRGFWQGFTACEGLRGTFLKYGLQRSGLKSWNELAFLLGAYGTMKRTLIIVPTYNERENLPTMAERLSKLPIPVDLLVVDDNSPDGTGQIADELAAKNPFIHVLHRSEKNGLGRAYCAGFGWALERDYEFIMEMDGDFSHNPDDIPRFIEAAQDADLVLGSRYCNGIRVINWPLRRLLLSTSAARYVQIITGMPFTDPTGGFKCFRRRTLQSINLDAVRSNGYSFQIELTHKIWRNGMKIVEIPIIFTDRFLGASKMSRKIVWEALAMVWQLLFQNGLRRSPHPRK
jgi:dolichol-phosphate mannosyltransferase